MPQGLGYGCLSEACPADGHSDRILPGSEDRYIPDGRSSSRAAIFFGRSGYLPGGGPNPGNVGIEAVRVRPSPRVKITTCGFPYPMSGFLNPCKASFLLHISFRLGSFMVFRLIFFWNLWTGSWQRGLRGRPQGYRRGRGSRGSSTGLRCHARTRHGSHISPSTVSWTSALWMSGWLKVW